MREGEPPSQYNRNQAQNGWICDALRPNLAQTFFRPLVTGELMTANARLIPVVAVLLMALGNACLSTGSARAEENCLAAPNTQPPQGSHWYYRTDPVKQSKCWHLRTEGQAIQTPAAQQEPGRGLPNKPLLIVPEDVEGEAFATLLAATGAAGVKSKTAPAQVAPETRVERRPVQPAQAALDSGTTQEITQDGARVGGQAKTDPVAWPDPPSPAGADRVVWPDPPSPVAPATQEAASESASAEKVHQARDVPATTTKMNQNAQNTDGTDKQVAEPANMAGSQRMIADGTVLAFAIGLVIAGIFLRFVVRMTFARRRTIYVDRRESDWTDSIASKARMPEFEPALALAPGLVDNDRLADEVEDALRKLSRVLDRQAA